MQDLITLEIEHAKKDFLMAILENFDFVSLQDNTIWQEILTKNDMEKEENKKPQTFRDFSFSQVLNNFNLDSQREELFSTVEPRQANDWLKQAMEMAKAKILRTEKERSECIISPILTELEFRHKSVFRMFSGESITIDKEKGLKGEFDFAFVKNPKATELVAPIFTLVEAKQGDITKYWGQIAAQMVGAREENKKRNENIKAIFGCITSGELWRFMKLENDIIYIDERPFSIYTELEKILGIFQYIVDFYK